MPNIVITQNSFSGGEISPEMYSRFDDPKHQSGAKKISNFIVKPQGPLEKRTGFEFVDVLSDQSQPGRLIPMNSSIYRANLLVINNKKITIYNRSNLNNEASENVVVGQIDCPYSGIHLSRINYVQSADVMTFVHYLYPPMELRKLQVNKFSLDTIKFSAQILPPNNLALHLVAGDTSNITNPLRFKYSYGVTSVSKDRLHESVISNVIEVDANFSLVGEHVHLTWAPNPEAAFYNIYRQYSGTYGFVGQSTGVEFKDSRVAADFSITPPIFEEPFTLKNDEGYSKEYPSCASYFEQRRVFAGTINQPHTVWMTRPGTETILSYSIPAKPDDRLKIRLASTDGSPIRHIVPLSNLMVLTGSTEWRISSASQADAITAATIAARPQSYIGTSNCAPVIINNTMIYVAERSNHVYECGFNMQTNGYASSDLSIRSAHLFDNDEVLEMAYSSAPTPILWCVMKSGKLLGLTYVPEQAVGAWHQHETNGIVENCAVMSEGNYDALYIIVKRNVAGGVTRTIERMYNPNNTFTDPAIFLDCSMSYSNNIKASVSKAAANTNNKALFETVLAVCINFFCAHASENELWHEYKEEIKTRGVFFKENIKFDDLSKEAVAIQKIVDKSTRAHETPDFASLAIAAKHLDGFMLVQAAMVKFKTKKVIKLPKYKYNSFLIFVFMKCVANRCVEFRFSNEIIGLVYSLISSFDSLVVEKINSSKDF